MSITGLNSIQTVHSHFEPSKQITHPDYSEDLSAEVVAHYRANGDCAMLAAAMAEEIRTD
jgi:hypothetical protein